jgi:LPS-assembly lipoprotein
MRAATLAAMAALGVLAGCGFHLRGGTELSARMHTPYIDAADHYSPFYAELRDALQAAGAQLAPGATGASAVVRVNTDKTGRNVLTISARNTPQEFEVYYTVEYSVTAGGKEILPRQKLTLTRDYAYDDSQLLAKQHEEDDIRAALARDLAGLVTRRLAALKD